MIGICARRTGERPFVVSGARRLMLEAQRLLEVVRKAEALLPFAGRLYPVELYPFFPEEDSEDLEECQAHYKRHRRATLGLAAGLRRVMRRALLGFVQGRQRWDSLGWVLELAGERVSRIDEGVLDGLRARARPAPYGDSLTQTTVFDAKVRDALEVPDHLWDVSPLVCEAAAELWCLHMCATPVAGGIVAVPRHLNVYAPGGHFAPHRDTPDRGLVGTFVLVWHKVSRDSAGGLRFWRRRDDTAEEALDEIGRELPDSDWVAFYPDTIHSVVASRDWRVTVAFDIRHGEGAADQVDDEVTDAAANSESSGSADGECAMSGLEVNSESSGPTDHEWQTPEALPSFPRRDAELCRPPPHPLFSRRQRWVRNGCRVAARLPSDLTALVAVYVFGEDDPADEAVCEVARAAWELWESFFGRVAWVLAHAYTVDTALDSLRGSDAILREGLESLVAAVAAATPATRQLRVTDGGIVVRSAATVCRSPDGCSAALCTSVESSVYALGAEQVEWATAHPGERPGVCPSNHNGRRGRLFFGPAAGGVRAYETFTSGSEMQGNSCDPSRRDSVYVNRALFLDEHAG